MDDNYRWYLLRLKQHENMICQAFNRFRDRGIEPILIKGWATAKLYPRGVPRFFGDTDLAVAGSDFANASRLCENADIKALNIDLHNEFRHLDSESWDEVFGRSKLVDLYGTNIRILCPEDHLRIICIHWLNDGGEHQDRLWDVYYAVQNRHPEFDWDLCLSTVSEVRRRWIICAIGLAHRYLSLEIDDLPFADEAKDLPGWMERTVEKEWKSSVRLRTIHLFWGNPKLLFEQIRKRVPPNPIQSTIEMEGSFDARSRSFYQIGAFIKRIGPSAKKFLRR